MRRSDDRRLERTIGSDAGLRVIFSGMARRFRPDKAAGFEGEIQYELGLRRRDEAWMVDDPRRAATARQGRADDPKLTLVARAADFVRLIARASSTPARR